jgi:hypothetical protein
MTTPAEPETAARLRRALLAFQKAQGMLLSTHRRLKDLPAAEVERFWATQGSRLERHARAAATEVTAAFAVFSAAGLVASAADRHLVTEARRSLSEGR